jgi:hypothetical protein
MDEQLVTPSGQKTKIAGTLDYVQAGTLHVGSEVRAVMVTSADDLTQLTGYTPGSIAYTAGFKSLWQLAASGEWIQA